MLLKIATFNFWGLPWPFSVQKRMRRERLVDWIKNENLDFLAGQEIWLNYDLNFFASHLPGYHCCDKRNKAFNHNGLFFISRFPLECSLALSFDTPLLSLEFPSKKGLLRAEIKLDGQKIQMIDTHVYYSSTEVQAAHQKHQLDQLIKILGVEPTLLFGDFNQQYSILNLPSHFHLISEAAKPSIVMKNPYVSKRLNRINKSDRLPDYIFANFPVKVLKSYLITEPLISDHFPVVCEIEIG